MEDLGAVGRDRPCSALVPGAAGVGESATVHVQGTAGPDGLDVGTTAAGNVGDQAGTVDGPVPLIDVGVAGERDVDPVAGEEALEPAWALQPGVGRLGSLIGVDRVMDECELERGGVRRQVGLQPLVFGVPGAQW